MLTRVLFSVMLAPCFGFLSLIIGVLLCIATEDIGMSKETAEPIAFGVFGAVWSTLHHQFWTFAKDHEPSQAINALVTIASSDGITLDGARAVAKEAIESK